MYHQIRTIYNQQALWPTLCKSYLESTIKLDFTLDLQLKITLNKKYKKKSNLWEFGTWDNVTQTESECKEKLWSGRVYELTCRPCPIKKKTHSTRKSRSPRPKKKKTLFRSNLQGSHTTHARVSKGAEACGSGSSFI